MVFRSPQLDSDLIVFGGPYSNFEALQALRAYCMAEKIPPENCICTGDIIAYCADAKACLDEIRDWGCLVIQGNCEESLAQGADDCGCGFQEGSACDLLSKQWFEYASSQIDGEDRQWMGDLPRSLVLEWGGLDFLVVHGGLTEINRFLFASQTREISQELDQASTDIVLSGHSGIPFAKDVESRLWLNAGVIGMPANDGDSKTWFARLSQQETGLICYDFNELTYNYEQAASKMREKGLSEGYASALETGIWPSLDVLPDLERKQQGQPLDLERGYFRAASSTNRLRIRAKKT